MAIDIDLDNWGCEFKLLVRNNIVPEAPERKSSWILCILMVVGILAVLAAVLTVASSSSPDWSNKTTRTEAMIQVITMAYMAYVTDNGSLPKNLNNHGFVQPISGANPMKAPYMNFKPNYENSEGDLVDAWGTPFRINYSSDKDVLIVSAGPDKFSARRTI